MQLAAIAANLLLPEGCGVEITVLMGSYSCCMQATPLGDCVQACLTLYHHKPPYHNRLLAGLAAISLTHTYTPTKQTKCMCTKDRFQDNEGAMVSRAQFAKQYACKVRQQDRSLTVCYVHGTVLFEAAVIVR